MGTIPHNIYERCGHNYTRCSFSSPRWNIYRDPESCRLKSVSSQELNSDTQHLNYCSPVCVHPRSEERADHGTWANTNSMQPVCMHSDAPMGDDNLYPKVGLKAESEKNRLSVASL